MSNPEDPDFKRNADRQSLGCRVCCRKQQCGGLYFVLTQEIPTIWIRKSRSEPSAKSATGWKVRKHHDQKLRRKFVIINMSPGCRDPLCVVLGMFCFTRIHAFRAESEIAMRQMLDSSRSKEPPKNDTKPQSPSLDFGPGGRNPAFNSTPVFLVTLDENNEITDTNSSGSYTVTDTLSEAAVSAAFAVSEDHGYLSDLKLRFIKAEYTGRHKIAFADTVQETRALGELVIQCVMMLLLFLLCFLLVSIFWHAGH